VEPHLSQANAALHQTALLDVLIRLEDIGVELASDGNAVLVPWQFWGKVPEDLLALIREVNHDLARLLGVSRRNNTESTSPPIERPK
jgi:hypothetical protein